MPDERESRTFEFVVRTPAQHVTAFGAQVAADEVLQKTEATFEDLIAAVKDLAARAEKGLQGAGKDLSEIDLQFGLTLRGGARLAFVGEIGAEGQVRVTLSWKLHP